MYRLLTDVVHTCTSRCKDISMQRGFPPSWIKVKSDRSVFHASRIQQFIRPLGHGGTSAKIAGNAGIAGTLTGL